MVRILLLSFIILLTSRYTGSASMNQSLQNSFPFMLLDEEYVLFEVTADDSLTGTWGFDTGAGIHILSNRLFTQLNAKPAGRLTAFQMGGERLDLDVCQISSLSIGSYREEHPYVITWDYIDSLGVDGILSVKFFEHHPVTLDLKNKQLVFETKESLGELADNGYVASLETQRVRDKSLDIFAVIQVNASVIIEMEFDTGSGKKTFLDYRLMEQLGLDETSDNLQSIQIDNDTIYTATLTDFALHDAPEVNSDSIEVYFKRDLIYDGVLGTYFWLDRRITIDIPGQRFIINE